MRTRFAASRDGFRWPNWLRRGLLAAALCVVVLGVVGMHQLSFGHSLATPPAADSHEHGATHPHAVHNQAAEQTEGANPAGGVAHATAGGVQDKQANAGRRISERAATWGGSSSGGGDACPGCGQHSMAFSVCLLAFTLLVLTWLLTPPTARRPPPRWLRQPPTPAVPTSRPVPALSLAELSVLRL
ncbi:MAG TPA: hypothetical protein VF635_06260 [Propionibacteriaceae bacterium]